MRFKGSSGKYGGWIYHSKLLSVSDVLLFSCLETLYIDAVQRLLWPSLTCKHTHAHNASTSLPAVRFINCMLVHSQSDLGLRREVKEGRSVSGRARERDILIGAPEPTNCRPT